MPILCRFCSATTTARLPATPPFSMAFVSAFFVVSTVAATSGFSLLPAPLSRKPAPSPFLANTLGPAWHSHDDHARSSAGGPPLLNPHGVHSRLVGIHGAAPLAAAKSHAGSPQRCSQSRCRHCRGRHLPATGRRRKRFQRSGLFRW